MISDDFAETKDYAHTRIYIYTYINCYNSSNIKNKKGGERINKNKRPAHKHPRAKMSLSSVNSQWWGASSSTSSITNQSSSARSVLAGAVLTPSVSAGASEVAAVSTV